MTVMRLEADVLGPYGRNTAKGALSILMGFPGNSWGGAFPSWRIMLLHEIQALSALCFPAGRRWIQSSQGTQNWQSGQQSLVWAEWRIQVHVQKARVPLGSPAIIEWLRVSESAAQIYDHTFRCIGLGIQFWKCWHSKQSTAAGLLVCIWYLHKRRFTFLFSWNDCREFIGLAYIKQ